MTSDEMNGQKSLVLEKIQKLSVNEILATDKLN